MNQTDIQPAGGPDAGQANAAVQRYANQYEQLQASRSGESSWINDIRWAAMTRFMELGFPTPRDEEWRFTNIAPIADFDGTTTTNAAPVNAELYKIAPDAHRLVFVNGLFNAELSSIGVLPEGVVVGSLAKAIAVEDETVKIHLARHAASQDNAFTALNTAFLQDGAYIYVPHKAVVEAPIHLLFIGTSGTSHPRNLVVAGDMSEATIVEHYVGEEGAQYFTNSVTEVVAGQNAQLDHYKVQHESRSAFHIGTMQVQQERDCHFSSLNVVLGGAIVRNNAGAVMGGEGIECTLNGLFVATGTQLIDNHTVMDHAQPHCNSYEVYAGILDDEARGVFNGKIFVREDAQKTDAKQTNRNLLLSKKATIDTKPQLEIFADDVKCTHGATIGQLDDDAVFYLQARGIGREDARALLTYAFANDLINNIKIDVLREQLSTELLERLTHIHRED